MENQQKANDQQNAIDLENQGNMLFAQGSMRARSLSTRLRRRFTEGWNWMSWQIT